MSASHIPPGLPCLMPYLTVEGAARLLQFAKEAFDAVELERHEDGGRIMHAAVRLGDSVIETGDANDRWGATPASLHYYVPDCDAAYRRALEAGAESLMEPTDMPYGERSAAVRDPVGNKWYLATFTGRPQ